MKAKLDNISTAIPRDAIAAVVDDMMGSTAISLRMVIFSDRSYSQRDDFFSEVGDYKVLKFFFPGDTLTIELTEV